MNSSIWKVKHEQFYENDKLDMNAIICILHVIIWNFFTSNTICKIRIRSTMPECF